MRTNEFFSFVHERESVRLKKEAGAPFPWTDDTILQTYKFTNVRREHDRTTKRFIEHYASHHDAMNIAEQFLNCAVARYFGDADFVASLGWIDNGDDITGKILHHVNDYRHGNPKKNVFTGAYVVSNFGRTEPKEEVVCGILEGLWRELKEGQLLYITTRGSWKETVENMRSLYGFGGSGFMAKEVTLDTMFFSDIWGGLDRPLDYWRWTPIGPGSARGVGRVLYEDFTVNEVRIPEAKVLKVIMSLYESQEGRWPSDWGRLSPHDIQFQLCEFDKYERVRLGQGRPRSKYRPQVNSAR